MIRVAADDKIPFLAESPLAEYTHLIRLPGSEISRQDLMDADALITRTRTRCDAALLEGTSVRMIATATIGYDHIDQAFCSEHGILWQNAPGCNADSVAQYMTSAILHLFPEPAGKKIGIIGAGHVGKRVAAAAEALGMKVLQNDPPRAEQEGPKGFVPLDQLLAESDLVTLHPYLEKGGKYPTFHLADASFFAKMRRDAFFVNASRGSICDNTALKTALQDKQIAGAILDVWENEPVFDRELLSLLIAGTPHIAGYSTDGKANGTAAAVNAVGQFFELGFPEWRPVPPLPENPELSYTSVADAVAESYDLFRDSAALRNAPDSFEQLRGSYPLRREFHAYTVRNCPEEAAETLRRLGFLLPQ